MSARPSDSPRTAAAAEPRSPAPRRDAPVVVIGGGVNGLVAACLLARAGIKTLVLERREILGGLAVTEEIHPGFRCPTLAHSAGPFSADLLRELGLAAHGLEAILSEVRVHAPSLTGPSLTIYQDHARTARELASLSKPDADRYPAFAECLAKLGAMLRPVLAMTPPSMGTPSLPEAWRLLRLGKSFRDLGKKDGYRLLRWGPMAVADLVAEWFETDLLRAAVAARGIHSSLAGPWSAGTSIGLLFQAALDGHATLPSASFRGGPGALAQALAAAARAAGAEIRTGARVLRIQVEAGRASLVLLANGETIPARAVVSAADPKTTLLGLIDPVDLEPDFLQKIRNYRAMGSAAKLNYALSGLPAFGGSVSTGLPAGAGASHLSGRIHIGPGIDYLERAFDASKYGDLSTDPYLDLAIPSVADPSLAPKGAHVLSVHVQFAPHTLRSGDWSTRRNELADAVDRALVAHAPNFPGLVLARQIITPSDLESVYGLFGGHMLHGEPALDQIFTMRPILGWAQYRTPIQGLYLCSAGTHPGGSLTGLPGRNAAREILGDLRAER